MRKGRNEVNLLVKRATIMERLIESSEYFMPMIPLVSKKGSCIRRQVGCIITDEDNRILAAEYNCVPHGSKRCDTENKCLGAEDIPGDTTRCQAIHAEINAIINNLRPGSERILYCSSTPCLPCAKAILATRIERVIATEMYKDLAGIDYLKSHGVPVYLFDVYRTKLQEL